MNLGCKLDLKTIALRARNAEYNPKVRPIFMYFRLYKIQRKFFLNVVVEKIVLRLFLDTSKMNGIMLILNVKCLRKVHFGTFSCFCSIEVST